MRYWHLEGFNCRITLEMPFILCILICSGNFLREWTKKVKSIWSLVGCPLIIFLHCLTKRGNVLLVFGGILLEEHAVNAFYSACFNFFWQLHKLFEKYDSWLSICVIQNNCCNTIIIHCWTSIICSAMPITVYEEIHYISILSGPHFFFFCVLKCETNGCRLLNGSVGAENMLKLTDTLTLPPWVFKKNGFSLHELIVFFPILFEHWLLMQYVFHIIP